MFFDATFSFSSFAYKKQISNKIFTCNFVISSASSCYIYSHPCPITALGFYLFFVLFMVDFFNSTLPLFGGVAFTIFPNVCGGVRLVSAISINNFQV